MAMIWSQQMFGIHCWYSPFHMVYWYSASASVVSGNWQIITTAFVLRPTFNNMTLRWTILRNPASMLLFQAWAIGSHTHENCVCSGQAVYSIYKCCILSCILSKHKHSETSDMTWLVSMTDDNASSSLFPVGGSIMAALPVSIVALLCYAVLWVVSKQNKLYKVESKVNSFW